MDRQARRHPRPRQKEVPPFPLIPASPAWIRTLPLKTARSRCSAKPLNDESRAKIRVGQDPSVGESHDRVTATGKDARPNSIGRSTLRGEVRVAIDFDDQSSPGEVEVHDVAVEDRLATWPDVVAPEGLLEDPFGVGGVIAHRLRVATSALVGDPATGHQIVSLSRRRGSSCTATHCVSKKQKAWCEPRRSWTTACQSPKIGSPQLAHITRGTGVRRWCSGRRSCAG